MTCLPGHAEARTGSGCDLLLSVFFFALSTNSFPHSIRFKSHMESTSTIMLAPKFLKKSKNKKVLETIIYYCTIIYCIYLLI